MMHYILPILLFLLTLPCFAQTKQIKDLKNQKAKIEQDIKKSKNQLNQNRQQTVKKEQTADFLENQLQNRLQYIHRLEMEMDTLQCRVDRLEDEVQELDSQVTLRKQKYIRSLRAARQSQAARNPVLFIFSAESFPKMVRRMRYAREQASLQKNLGIQLMEKQNQARNKQDHLLAAKQEMSGVVQEVIRQRHQLASRHSVVKAGVAQLHKQQKEIEQQMREQQQKLTALNKKIDELVAYEIEQARKRAEAEAKRKREAELAAQRAQAQKDKKKGTQSKTQTSSNKTNSKSSNGKSSWLTAEDRQLNGSLEQNKGRLPVPLTGPYRVARRFGLNQVAKGIMLDNKGVNYMGQAGARARAIYDGVVSAVFQLGDQKNVLIRHGSYISVYCNLSSTIVTRGQKVRARDLIGTVAEDEQGNYILHFQLRKETTKLNPESWIGR
ncbi:MAG: peptidoglycan DD-metalloendopeptidase family protein [Bacteroidaceae bacterium]|nr:peptidoglycan DD-metalloendopeptidase family protein [Bacteroidaceae bacterium]